MHSIFAGVTFFKLHVHLPVYQSCEKKDMFRKEIFDKMFAI